MNRNNYINHIQIQVSTIPRRKKRGYEFKIVKWRKLIRKALILTPNTLTITRLKATYISCYYFQILNSDLRS